MSKTIKERLTFLETELGHMKTLLYVILASTAGLEGVEFLMTLFIPIA